MHFDVHSRCCHGAISASGAGPRARSHDGSEPLELGVADERGGVPIFRGGLQLVILRARSQRHVPLLTRRGQKECVPPSNAPLEGQGLSTPAQRRRTWKAPALGGGCAPWLSCPAPEEPAGCVGVPQRGVPDPMGQLEGADVGDFRQGGAEDGELGTNHPWVDSHLRPTTTPRNSPATRLPNTGVRARALSTFADGALARWRLARSHGPDRRGRACSRSRPPALSGPSGGEG